MNVADYIAEGVAKEMDFKVEGHQSAAQIGSGPQLSEDGQLEVLSTPSLIAFMETLAYQMLQDRLPEGLTSVGTQVQISHMAPTPVGNTLRIQAKVSQIDSRRLTFTLQAWDEAGLVGEGTHTRVVVERQRFIQNVKAKLGSR